MKVRKPRGVDNVLNIELITRKEYMDSMKAAQERGKKIARECRKIALARYEGKHRDKLEKIIKARSVDKKRLTK